MAHEMNIDKLLPKLSVGDMVATEAKYRRTCLIKFCNSYRKHNREQKESKLTSKRAINERNRFFKGFGAYWRKYSRLR